MEPNIYIESLFLKLIADRNALLADFSEKSKSDTLDGVESGDHISNLEHKLESLSNFDNKIKILATMFPDLPKLLNLDEIKRKQQERDGDNGNLTEEEIAKNNPEYGKAEVIRGQEEESAESTETEIKS